MLETETVRILLNLFFHIGYWVGIIFTFIITLIILNLTDLYRNKKLLNLIQGKNNKKIFCIAVGLKYKEEK